MPPGIAPSLEIPTATASAPPPSPFGEIGVSGLRRAAGFLQEEFLPELRGPRGMAIYREMADNSSMVGACLAAIMAPIKQLPHRIEPASADSEALKIAAFVETCFDDMSFDWDEMLSEILTTLIFGHSYHEVVYKLRHGDQNDPTRRSRYSDGLIGWRKIALRAQETLFRWEFDEEGGIKGMHQLAAPSYVPRFIPIEKALLFRTRADKNNPEGRALDPETPIPTPDGWRKLGQIQPSDKVFDEAGRIRYVTARAEWEARPCFALTFSDGSEIVSDAEHLWFTRTHSERQYHKPGRARTTAEIARTLKMSAGKATRQIWSNHAIPWAKPLDHPVVVLPLDPYFVGLWLGDGASLSSNISCHADDVLETVAALEACGYSATIAVNGRSENGRMLHVRGAGGPWAADAPQRALRALGLTGNKHVPAIYMRSSIDQRLALLSGLMDSDGHVDDYGRCEFSNVNAGLAHSVAELVRSLGVGARVTTKRNSIGNTAWLVKFTPTFVPFRLARKAARIKPVRARENHYIVAAEAVEPRTTVCIEVDSPSHLFLAGDGMVPTHNSILRSAYFSWYFSKRIQETEAIGIERELTGVPVAYVPIEIMNPDAPANLKAIRATIEKAVRELRLDEQMGLVIGQSYDDKGNPKYKLELLSTGGRRAIDTTAVVARYNQQIASSMSADFLLLGHTAVGSRALADPKIDFFFLSVQAVADMIAGIFNRHALPRLLKLNNIPTELSPSLAFGDVKSANILLLSEYLKGLADAGMPLFPDERLEAYLRDVASLPAKSAEEPQPPGPAAPPVGEAAEEAAL